MVYCISRSDFPKQREDASNSSNYSLQEYSNNFYKKYSRKHKSRPKSCSSKQHHSRSHSSSSRQASSSSNYSPPKKYDNSSRKGKQHGSSSLKKSSNKRYKSPSYQQRNSRSHIQSPISSPKPQQTKISQAFQIKTSQSGTNYYNSTTLSFEDFEKDGAPSQESMEIIAAVESTISGENKYTIVEITSETQEQTTTQNALNSREVNDELFGI
ncbi:12299_t:CDS:2 [Cetraspora pellucida]|uniref:12299_t:CDS:1 n=1 Tax=Cetraspora pellucida TaxID=1433469 RepID=A0ACA9LXE4_9GLOM|nr:12299_t:CDS:2 [Cetraspora pellucida]